VKWGIDPGLEGDFYADKPYLYGPLLSSINVLRVGGQVEKKGTGYEIPSHLHEDGLVEGADGDGEEAIKHVALPDGAAERKKWALHEDKRKEFHWEEGRVYRGDFFNPYLDFNDFALKLPGFSLSVLGLLNGQDSLRYTLKNQKTGDVFFVVVFTLVPEDVVDKEDAEDTAKADGQKASEANEGHAEPGFEPKADDLD